MKKEKMNNKGFSLVELIIVIAIMAVLVVVLAPQYLKYVEKSRNSTDASNATAMCTALQVYAADPDASPALTTGQVVTITVYPKGGASDPVSSVSTSSVASGAVDPGDQALKEAAITIADVTCKSKTNWSSYKITATVKSDGSLEFNYDPDNSTEGAAFKAYMTK